MRLVAIIAISGSVGFLEGASRDTLQYERTAIYKAEQYAEGNIQWSRWIDDGWPEFLGLVHYLFGPSMVLILLINAALGGGAAVLAYCITTVAFADERVGRVTGIACAVFPSSVYYHALPLKEALAGYAIMAIVWGLMKILAGLAGRRWLWLLAGILLITMIRLYLVPVFAACTATCLVVRRARNKTQALVFACVSIGGLGAGLYYFKTHREVELLDGQMFEYYDVEKVSQLRVSLSRGNARMYSDRDDAGFGDDWLENAGKMLRGLFFFVVSLDLTRLNRDRQFAAIPEVLFFLASIPYLYQAIVHGCRTRLVLMLPILLFCGAIIAVYGSAATNMGAMYRWRLQALPFLIMLTMYGMSLRHPDLFRRLRPA